MQKYRIKSVVISILLVITMGAYGQNPHQLKIGAKAYTNKIMFRWLPSTYQAWQKANQYGYKVERTTTARNNILLTNPVTVVLTPQAYKPLPDSLWIAYQDSAVHTVMRGALYGTVETNQNVIGADTLMILNDPTVNEVQQRYTIGLMAAELKFSVAKMAALGYTDATAIAGERYTYRISTLVPANELVIDPVEITIELTTPPALPVPAKPSGQFGDRTVLLKWNYDTLRTVYNAYWVERSLNNINFVRINKLPLVNLVDDGSNPFLFYQDKDTTLKNDITYYYRVVGKTPFDEEKASEVILGQPVSAKKAYLRVSSTKLLNNTSVEIKWEYGAIETIPLPTITKFKIKKATSDNGYYVVVKDNIAASSRTETIQNVLDAQYFVVTGITSRGDSLTSYPVLVQTVDTIPPMRPTGLTVGQITADSLITLQWNKNTESDLLGYHVFRAYQKNEEPSRITPVPISANQLADTLRLKMLNDANYYFVAAMDKRFNQSPLSLPFILKKPDKIPPSEPIFSNYQLVPEGVQLNWIKSPDPDVVKHILYRKDVIASTIWEVIAVLTNQDVFTDNQALAGKRYAYALVAEDASGLQSKVSPPLIVQIPQSFVQRTQLSNFTATLNPTRKQIDLTWSFTANNLSEFQVYRAVGDAKLSLWTVLNASENGITDAGLTPNQYKYAIQGVFNDGKTTEWREAVVIYDPSTDPGFVFSPSNNSPLCTGQTLNLSAASGSSTNMSFSWAGPNNFSSSSQYPMLTNVTTNANGVYTVTLSNSTNSATYTAITQVRIHAMPTASIIAPTAICQGEKLNLVANGGTNAEAFSWSSTGFTSTSRAPVFASVPAGDYSFSVTITNGVAICTTTASVQVSVKAVPTATIVAPITVCEGQNVQLSANGTLAGNQIRWSGPNNFYSQENTPLLTAANSGMDGLYKFSIITPTSCTVSLTTSVKVLPKFSPIISATSPMCGTDTLRLSVTGITSPVTYSWRVADGGVTAGFTSTLQAPKFKTVASSNHTASITIAHQSMSSCSVTNSIVIKVSTKPILRTFISSGINCEGNNIVLASEPTVVLNGLKYTWSGPGGFNSTLQYPQFQGAKVEQSGTYTVSVDNAGCVVTSSVSLSIYRKPTITLTNNSVSCTGEALFLSIRGGLPTETYKWSVTKSGTEVFNSTIQAPTLSNLTVGQYTISGSVYNSQNTVCSASSTLSINLNQSPEAGIWTNPVCVGQTASLAPAYYTGYTYSWKGPNNFTSTAINPQLSNATTAMEGVYSVTSKLGSCTNSATASLRVIKKPVIVVQQNNPGCLGESLILSISGGLPTESYRWSITKSGTEVFNSTIQAPTLSNLSVGQYIVSGTVYNTQNIVCLATSVFVVTINPIPEAGIWTNPVCIGETASLAPAYYSGYTYSWKGPNNFTSTAINPQLSNATTAMEGAYSVTSKLASCTNSATTFLSIKRAPIATIQHNAPICAGESFLLTASGGNSIGETYAWSGDDAFTSTVKSPSIPIAVGRSGYWRYTLTVSVPGCSFAISTTSVSVSAYGVPNDYIYTAMKRAYCAGETIVLQTYYSAFLQTSSYSFNYAWTGPNGFTSTLRNPTIPSSSVANNGIYTLVESQIGLPRCVTVYSVSVLVRSTPTPTITSNSPISVGQTLNLTANGGVANEKYQWSGSNSFSSTVKSPAIANLTTGNYSYSVTIKNESTVIPSEPTACTSSLSITARVN